MQQNSGVGMIRRGRLRSSDQSILVTGISSNLTDSVLNLGDHRNEQANTHNSDNSESNHRRCFDCAGRLFARFDQQQRNRMAGNNRPCLPRNKWPLLDSFELRMQICDWHFYSLNLVSKVPVNFCINCLRLKLKRLVLGADVRGETAANGDSLVYLLLQVTLQLLLSKQQLHPHIAGGQDRSSLIHLLH